MLATLLSGKKVRLTALNNQDAPTITRWHENADFLRLLDTNPAVPRTEADISEWIVETNGANNEVTFAIRLIDGDELIGTIGFDGIEWPNQVAGLSIGIGDRSNWNRGYGYEAIQLALAYAFNELNLHRIQLTVFSYNKSAIALYEKAGFTREGVHRERLRRDGKRYDMYLYGLLHHEWESQNAR